MSYISIDNITSINAELTNYCNAACPMCARYYIDGELIKDKPSETVPLPIKSFCSSITQPNSPAASCGRSVRFPRLCCILDICTIGICCYLLQYRLVVLFQLSVPLSYPVIIVVYVECLIFVVLCAYKDPAGFYLCIVHLIVCLGIGNQL